MTATAKLYAFLAALGVIATLILGGVGWVNHMNRALRDARAEAAASQAKATTATTQSAVQADAGIIADRGVQRDGLTSTLHEDHAHALAATKGGTSPVDPSVNAAGRRGLCEYAAYADDPGCAGLHQVHPAQLPPAH